MSDHNHEAENEAVLWLQGEIGAAIDEWRANGLAQDYWRKPLAAIASANDPLLGRLREVASPEHAMPGDLLPDAVSVVVFFLPFQRKLGQQNSTGDFHAARSWAEAYIATNQLIAAINDHLQDVLQKEGYRAAVTPATHNFDTVRLMSGWSHKHLGYIAGLGTFGHNQLLITRAGCCGRLGSLITTMPLRPTARPDREWCLRKAGFRCSGCIARCRYDALTETSFDRHACYRQCLLNDEYYSDLALVDVCGKCSCEVPCSYGIPESKRVQGAEKGGRVQGTGGRKRRGSS